jgi:TPR repeat protein
MGGARGAKMHCTALLIARVVFALVVALVLSPAAAQADCASGDFAACTARCAKGDGEACSTLGAIYRTGGHGVARDEARAVELYRRACNLGSAKGCRNLREMYSEGRGVKGRESK